MNVPNRPAVLQLFNTMGMGGMERQIVQLVRVLRHSGRYNVHVATQSARGPAAAELAKVGIVDVPVFPLTRLYNAGAMIEVGRFAAHLRRLKVDILHTHDFYTTTFGMSAALLARVPVRVAARRELDVFTPRQRRVEHLAYRVAHAVVANCERLRLQLIQEGLPPSRAVTIPNAVEVDRVSRVDGNARERLATRLGIRSGHRVVTSLAHLHNRKKDFATLLRSLALLVRGCPDLLCVIAGEGSPDDRQRVMHQAAGLGVADRVLLPGHVDEVGALLALSEVGVLSTLSEGLPNAVLEYMAAGLPVVASRVGGVPEAVIDGQTGFLVDPGDAPSLAGRITTLLENRSLAAQMGRLGSERARRHFSPVALLDRTSTLYERLLGQRSALPGS